MFKISKKKIYFLNLHGRSEIGWIERKKQFSNFYDFSFSIYSHLSVIFCDVITRIFDDNSKNINLRIFSLFFPYYTPRSPSSIKHWSKVRGGVCISIVGKHPVYCLCHLPVYFTVWYYISCHPVTTFSWFDMVGDM